MSGEPIIAGDPPVEVGCTFIMWRGHITGNVVTCGVCDWCRDHFDPGREEPPPGTTGVRS